MYSTINLTFRYRLRLAEANLLPQTWLDVDVFALDDGGVVDSPMFQRWRALNADGAAWVILEYFTGVCPPAYYEARAKKGQQSRVLDEHRRELKLLERTLDRFSRTVPVHGPKLSAANFEAEIEQLRRAASSRRTRASSANCSRSRNGLSCSA
ncbi:hypothetical protein [Aquabacterium sp.]|uniref:hypothetical protein n=1 Tax=Aquabacterium sp. TaxID=1872578 RepID=UPI0025C50650|nr:hypothetical protein [Aquabacterium sp.]